MITRARLTAWLARAQRLGLVGPGDPEAHIDHAERFLAALPDDPATVLDLGTGGGIPGLALALWLPNTMITLLDAKERATDALRGAVIELEIAARVQVITGRAEVLAQDLRYRERFDVVVCRSFGAPATTAECAAGFVAVGGRLVVSEPPDVASPQDRWPVETVPGLGLAWATGEAAPDVAILRKVAPTASTYPRRVDLPSRRPLFHVKPPRLTADGVPGQDGRRGPRPRKS